MANAANRSNNALWDLGLRTLEAHVESLEARIATIDVRLAKGIGTKGGYPTKRAAVRQRLKLSGLRQQLDAARRKLAFNRLSICIGGKALAR